MSSLRDNPCQKDPFNKISHLYTQIKEWFCFKNNYYYEQFLQIIYLLKFSKAYNLFLHLKNMFWTTENKIIALHGVELKETYTNNIIIYKNKKYKNNIIYEIKHFQKTKI